MGLSDIPFNLVMEPRRGLCSTRKRRERAQERERWETSGRSSGDFGIRGMIMPLLRRYEYIFHLAPRANVAREEKRVCTVLVHIFLKSRDLDRVLGKISFVLAAFGELFLCVRDIVSSISSAVPLWERDRATAGDLG